MKKLTYSFQSSFQKKLLFLIQYLASRFSIRGFPRLVWIFRNVIFGNGTKNVSYLNRFRILCDSNSYASTMAVSGFVYSRMDAILKIILRPNTALIDVGANVGVVSLLATSLHNNVQAHCFEPDPNVFVWLDNNCHLNQDLNLTLNNFALGSADGFGELTVSARSGWSTMAQEPSGGFNFLTKVDQVVVRVQSLDNYCGAINLKPSLIKIDVEGLELQVLQGAKQTIAAQRPYLLIEINPLRLEAANTTSEELINYIESMGYNLFHIDLFQGFFCRRPRRPLWNRYTRVFSSDARLGFDFDAIAVPIEKL